MSSDFILISQNVVILDESQSALPDIHSVPLPPLSGLLCSHQCMYCMSVYRHVYIKASSIQVMMEKEVPSSCESRQRPTPLYRCEYILSLCIKVYKCIHRHPVVSGPVSLMYCSFLWDISVFSSPCLCHEHSEPHKAFYCTQSEEGQMKLMETRLNLCSVPFCPWTVFRWSMGTKPAFYPVELLESWMYVLLFCASPAWSECILKKPAVRLLSLKMQLSKHQFFKEKC